MLLHPPPKRAKKHRFQRLQTGAGCLLHAIDISECTFFALLIYQFASPHPGHFNVLLCHNVCNSSIFQNRMFTKLLQNSTFPLWYIPVFYAKWRNIHVAQFFEPSLFISAKASILAWKQEQYLYVFCLDICNLRLSFWLLFCYHNCIQRDMCRIPVRDDVFCI